MTTPPKHPPSSPASGPAAAGAGENTPPMNQSAATTDHLPVRMLNEYAYCPRLFHFMHVEGRWEDNVFTIAGKAVHRRVDKLDHVLPDAPEADAKAEAAEDHGDDPPDIARSVPLASHTLGLSAKLDLVSMADGEAAPVETKRGRAPDLPEGAYEPERVQLMAQGLLLREHGYDCDHGIIYFAGSRRRVTIEFTPALESRTRELMQAAHAAATQQEPPLPLDDSPKCNGCSLAGICLPDETLALQQVPADPKAPAIRRLYPARDDAMPLYVQKQGAIVGKKGESITVKKKGELLGRVLLKDLSQVVLCGNIMVTAQTLRLLCEAGVPVVHLSSGYWFNGITHGFALRNSFARAAQYHTAADDGRRRALAIAITQAKAQNQRTLLMRNAEPRPDAALKRMKRLLSRLPQADSPGAVLGLEGSIAAAYFEHFAHMINDGKLKEGWNFTQRNRRPPRDPVNAMLSLGYAMLAKECTVALLAEGLDPWWGVFHQPRHGRPALALDLMEEFRPLVVDSAVLTAVNTSMLKPSQFKQSKAACIMQPAARKAFIKAYEARLNQLVSHPIFDYKCSWRAVIRVQARILAKWFRGEIDQYTGMITR